jgi:ankyrin repeat protein
MTLGSSLAGSADAANGQLRRAIQTRDLDNFNTALASGADVRALNVIGHSSLHDTVIYWGDLGAIDTLLSLGAAINATTPDGATPLLLALQHVHYSNDSARVEQVVKRLLARGANANTTDTRGLTPAAAAIEMASLPLLKLLTQWGAKLPPDALPRTLALGTHVELIQFLLDHPSDVDLALRNASGQTLAHLAAQSEKRLFLLLWLVQHGADVEARDSDGMTPMATAALGDNTAGMAYLLEHKALLTRLNRDGQVAIHNGAYGARYAVLQWLVEHGADLQARDRWGRRALDIAIDTHRFAFATDTDRLALSTLLGGNATDVLRGRTSKHPLHVAIWAEDLREINRLLNAGANANVKDETGLTPLGRAIDLASGGPATADQIAFGRKLLPLLLKHGADTTLRLPLTMETYDEYARSRRYGDELARIKQVDR